MLERIAHLLRMNPPAAANTGLLSASGDTVPSDAAVGYQTGCIFQHTDGGVSTALYANEGDEDSADFNAVGRSDSLLVSDLTDVGATIYTAGMLLVADGDSFEEVAVSSHATLAANGALTLATVSKLNAIPLTSFHPGGSGIDAVNVMTATPQGDGAELGLAVTAGAPVVGTSTAGNGTASANEFMVHDFVVPADYVVGEDLTVRISALLTVAAEAQSDLDVVAKLVKAGALDSTDLCATAAKDLKAVVAAADQDFVITGDASGDELAPGSIVHISISFDRDDTGGTAAGTTQINAVTVLVPSYR